LSFTRRAVKAAAGSFAVSLGDKLGEAAGNWIASKWLQIREEGWKSLVESKPGPVPPKKPRAK
jgi:hypothetical protein